MNTEYEIWNLMYLGFISNAMFMVAMVLLTWLGFRFAARIYDDSNANVAAKVTATLFYLLVGIMFYNTAQIGGLLLEVLLKAYLLLKRFLKEVKI